MARTRLFKVVIELRNKAGLILATKVRGTGKYTLPGRTIERGSSDAFCGHIWREEVQAVFGGIKATADGILSKNMGHDRWFVRITCSFQGEPRLVSTGGQFEGVHYLGQKELDFDNIVLAGDLLGEFPPPVHPDRF